MAKKLDYCWHLRRVMPSGPCIPPPICWGRCRARHKIVDSQVYRLWWSDPSGSP